MGKIRHKPQSDVRSGDYVLLYRDDGSPWRWNRDRVTTGPFSSIRWNYEEETDPQGVLEFTLEIDELPGWVVRLRHGLRDGAIRLINVEVEQADPKADSAPLYRKLGGQDLEQQIKAELCQDVLLNDLPPDWQQVALATRRSGRRPAGPLELAELCEDYLACWEESPRSPMKLLAERRHISVDTLQGHIRKAVEQGLWIREGHGKPGGYLTDRAIALLNGRNTTNG